MGPPPRRPPQLDSAVEVSDGQKIALDQLERIAEADGSAIRIIDVEDKDDANALLKVDVSMDCRHYEQVPDGLPLHARESVRLSIPSDFPFKALSVTTAHTRFLGFPHVQWGNYLCLYQSTTTQWIPSRGMFGLFEQLDDWLRRGALNELDDPEGPLHPPVAYRVSDTTICVQADTPGDDAWPWFGAAVLTERKPRLLEVRDWREAHDLAPGQLFAPAMLLDFEFPFEYPRTLRYLLLYMEKRGVETSRVLVHLMLAADRLPAGQALQVCIGAPSRAVAGNVDERLQHLQFWEIEPDDVAKLRAASTACDVSQQFQGQETPAEIQALINSVFESLFEWQKNSRVRWCSVIENRSEIVTRRDEGTAVDWFRGKRVAIWGCGAVGGAIAEHLARAGAAKLALYDNKLVMPGILVRQNFVEADVNTPKAEALKTRLDAIATSVDITAHRIDLITQTLNQPDWTDGVDIVIDATASLHVRAKLEVIIKRHPTSVPVAAMMISGGARHGVVVLSPVGYGAGPFDVLRRTGLAAMNRDWLSSWVRAFWTSETDEPTRQPEPGCSDPTFVGSHADVAGLSARMLNAVADSLTDEDEPHAIGYLFAKDNQAKTDHIFRFPSDIRIQDEGLEFRIATNAWRDVNGWIRSGARERSPTDETGGLLFGEFDEALGIAWVTHISGPPSDSTFSPERFNCGTEGTRELCDAHDKGSHGVVRYVGTWHSHPVSPAEPSVTDYAGIGSIFAAAPTQGAHQLMVIVGNASQPQQQIGAYAFEKRALAAQDDGVELAMDIRGSAIEAPPLPLLGKTIGLALSGGGSRAVAFHLGTLRALDDLLLLDDVQIVSGVSGGSVMTGLLGYSDAPFADIDTKTVDFLRRGLVVPALKKLVHPWRLLKLLSSFALSALPTMILELTAGVVAKITALLLFGSRLNSLIAHLRWPLRRWYSRTHVMADAVQAVVGSRRCDAATRNGKAIVFNACELRTGTAFRMSNERFGTWRFGWAPARELRVADAITASAAYPPFLPPFDWKRGFEHSGKNAAQRVVVTDGGVFDNLGVSVMEPGRNPAISTISYSPEIIIASDAGAGQFSGDAAPVSWPSRMTQVFNSVMRKVQDATKKRLHAHAEVGAIARFAYVNLGQADDRVCLKPSNWISRDEVLAYPTDFSAMSGENVERLSGRGEAITRALVTQYLLSD